MRGRIIKPCYFVVKDTRQRKVDFLKMAPEAQLLYRKNGFAFYVRNPQTDNQIK